MLKSNKKYQKALKKLIDANRGFINCNIGKNDSYNLPIKYLKNIKEGTPIGNNGLVAGPKGPTYMV